jgi:hypothetical protein
MREVAVDSQRFRGASRATVRDGKVGFAGRYGDENSAAVRFDTTGRG